MNKPDVTLIGAGLSGPLMASYLSSNGFSVDLYERRSDMRENKQESGRSINLALSERGIRALKDIGLFHQIKSHLIMMKGRMIHDKDSSRHLQLYGQKENEVLYSVSRATLNIALLEHAEKQPNVSISFNHQLNNVDFKNQVISIGEKNIPFNRLIGTDGFNSQLRRCMMKETNIQFQNKPLGHGYKELTIPPSSSGTYLMEPNALHIWPRGNFMLIALPNMDKSFTCTLFAPLKGDESFEEFQSENEIINLFKRDFPDTLKLIPSLVEEFKNNPVGKLATIYCEKWNYKDLAIIMGDAAHAIVPFFGQGMNASFQDCTVISSLINKNSGDLGSAFRAFSSEHVSNGHAIANMALENYIEMRDSVNDKNYKTYRATELLLEKKFPNRFIPRYSMVSFNEIPYSEVYRRGEIQTDLINAFISGKLSESKLNNEIINKLDPL